MKLDKENTLTEYELEQVQGAYLYETSNDSKFLNVLLRGTNYHRPDRYGRLRVEFSLGDVYKDMNAAWGNFGIYVDMSDVYKNTYKYGDKEITRDEAWALAEATVGKHLKREDWNW